LKDKSDAYFHLGLTFILSKFTEQATFLPLFVDQKIWEHIKQKAPSIGQTGEGQGSASAFEYRLCIILNLNHKL